MPDHAFVRLELMHVLQLLFQQPSGRVEPVQDDAYTGEPHIQRMPRLDMRPFVRQNLRPALLHIDTRDDDVAHPTERADRLVDHNKPHATIQSRHFTRTDQTHNLPDGIEKTPRKKQATTHIDCKQGCQPERHVTYRCRCLLNRYSSHQQKPLDVKHRALHSHRLVRHQTDKGNSNGKDNHAQQRHPVEPVERVSTQQQAVKKIERRQTAGRLQQKD